MRFRLEGNHSAYHSGCKAVWEVLCAAVCEAGGEVVSGEDYDVFVVNGEGSMHHGRPTFYKKMGLLKDALNKGRRAMLVNTVWQDNPSDYDGVLRKLSRVSVRETRSANELRRVHGTSAQPCLDFSYFWPLALKAPPQSREREGIYYTDYLDPAIANFSPLPATIAAGLSSGPAAEPRPLAMHEQSWEATVAMLAGAELLVTGRHHAVYAACRARTAFAAIEGNSHKIAGLIDWSGTSIPVAHSVDQLPDVIRWAQSNGDAFDRLFDFMEAQAGAFAPHQLFLGL